MGDTWDERWEQCWPLLLGYLPARDLICLSLSSRSIMSRLDSTPGWWQQACQALWPSHNTTAAAAPSPAAAALSPGAAACVIPPPSSAADQQARQLLLAATALAHHVKHSRSPPPQTVQLPPWLPGQPGKSRGFSRVEEPNSLDPPLLLTRTQLSWLAYGSLSGHTSGVFISTCSSSPRSHQPCAFLAAVVSNKNLLAELYIPRNTAPPDPWAGILTQPCTSEEVVLGCHTSSSGNDCSSSSSGSSDSAAGSATNSSSHQEGQGEGGSRGVDSATAAGIELWLSSAVQLQLPQQQQPAAGAGGGGRAGGRGGGRGRRRGGQQAAAGDRWQDIHKLIMDCIADNASRCKAVRGTTVIPPGTPAAAAVEQHLVRLASAGGPVLDLRRLQWEAAAAAARERGQQAAAAAAARTRLCERHQQGWHVVGNGSLQDASAAAAQGGSPAQPPHQHNQQQQHQGRDPSCSGHSSTSPCSGRPEPSAAAAAGCCLGWQESAAARLQAALEEVHLQRAAAAAAAAGYEQPAAAAEAAEGDRPELLAALVEQLPGVAPDVQLLVLPVLLPGGRPAQRIPGTGGSRLSAPKLLCLNVPFLMALRKHAWEKLPRLRHVLLMVGTPLPLLRPAAAQRQRTVCQEPQQQQQQQQQFAGMMAGHDPGESCGSNPAGGAVVQGTFTLQELEQQWQQQLQLPDGGQGGPQQQQQGQQLWEAEQQDEWFAQQVAQQRSWRGKHQPYAMQQEHGCDPGDVQERAAGLVGGYGGGVVGGTSRSGSAAVQADATLSRSAVDALHDMVHSCMDRSC